MPIALSPVINLDGNALPATWSAALVDLRVERQFQVPSRLTMRFVDPGYALVDAGTVTMGTTVTVADSTGEGSLISAEVTGVAVEQRTGDQPELVVVAHDRSHRMGRATDVKTYASMQYSDVVTQLVQSAGLVPSVTSTSEQFDYFMQADSALGLITELARRVGFDWWVDDGTFYFQAPEAGATVNLAMGLDLLSFSAKASGHGPDAATIDGWDRVQQQLVTTTVPSTSASEAVTASSGLSTIVASRASAFGTATLITAGVGAHTQTEASSIGSALVNRMAACSITAQGVTIGNAAIKPGAVVNLTDAGSVLSGTYPVTRVEHVYRPASGFTTRFYSGDRQPSSLIDTLGAARPAMPTHAHPGLVVGVVTNINSSTGQVKVRYPGLTAQYETGWARVLAVGGGNSRGAVFIPEVDDEVLVAFEGGDPRQPVVIGGLYGAKSVSPTTTITDGQVQNRGLTSRLGHGVQLFDGTDPAKQAIELSLAGNEHVIHMGKDKMTITVPSGYEFSIGAGDSSITIGTDGGITISAPKITLTGEQAIQGSAAQISLAADSTLSLEGQAQASMKGATVQIQAEGPLQAQGEPVMIN
jgi:phage baseplate assembly protein gpV/phage protein D